MIWRSCWGITHHTGAPCRHAPTSPTALTPPPHVHAVGHHVARSPETPNDHMPQKLRQIRWPQTAAQTAPLPRENFQPDCGHPDDSRFPPCGFRILACIAFKLRVVARPSLVVSFRRHWAHAAVFFSSLNSSPDVPFYEYPDFLRALGVFKGDSLSWPTYQ